MPAFSLVLLLPCLMQVFASPCTLQLCYPSLLIASLPSDRLMEQLTIRAPIIHCRQHITRTAAFIHILIHGRASRLSSCLAFTAPTLYPASSKGTNRIITQDHPSLLHTTYIILLS